jgi:O-antigen biosynthesis protein WbqP
LYARFGKRLLDGVLAAAALMILFPLLLIVAVAIFVEDRGPPIFRQPRVGWHGEPFTLLKFRSMPVGSSQQPSAAVGGLRVTRIGGVIRRTNIDELPQLVNILRGDMSMVGPRPALASQTALNALRRENGAWEVRPGLTGLAQVSSYDGMPDTEKAMLDARYSSRVTFARDFCIVLRTVGYLARRPPVY